MKLTLDDVFDGILGDSLEGMAFTICDRSEDQDFDWEDESRLWSSIDLLSPGSGRLVLVTDPETAKSLARSVTGEQPTDEATELAVLEELTNAIGGRWLAALETTGAETQLGLPKSGRGSLRPGEDAMACVYEVDAGRLGVLLASLQGGG